MTVYIVSREGNRLAGFWTKEQCERLIRGGSIVPPSTVRLHRIGKPPAPPSPGSIKDRVDRSIHRLEARPILPKDRVYRADGEWVSPTPTVDRIEGPGGATYERTFVLCACVGPPECPAAANASVEWDVRRCPKCKRTELPKWGRDRLVW